MKEYVKGGLVVALAVFTFASFGVIGHSKDSTISDDTYVVKNIPNER